MESGWEADFVLAFKKELSIKFPGDKKYAFENRNYVITLQYSSEYTIAYNNKLHGMGERKMRKAIFAIASLWFTAWEDDPQPDLTEIAHQSFSENELKDFEELNDELGKNIIKGRTEDSF
jgi:hypothetical protein